MVSTFIFLTVCENVPMITEISVPNRPHTMQIGSSASGGFHLIPEPDGGQSPARSTKEPLNQSPAAVSGSFSSTLRYREISRSQLLPIESELP